MDVHCKAKENIAIVFLFPHILTSQSGIPTENYHTSQQHFRGDELHCSDMHCNGLNCIDFH